MPELDWSKAPIHQEIKADLKTPELLLEGSLNCGKTTVGLDKEIDALLRWPGIRILLFRWVDDDVKSKLKPDFDVILDIRGLTPIWERDEKCYIFPNESRAYMFGLKTVSSAQLFSKIRGLGVSRILGDQVEEVDPAVAGELRGRLRPNLKATVMGKSFPYQLTFISNTEDHDFWLSKEFPLDNHIGGRRVFSLSVYDNPYLPQASIDSLLRQYPPDHPKHQTMILGRRGPNIVGDPVFEGVYRKDLHWRPIKTRTDAPMLESFDFGKHNPTWVFGQRIFAGGLAILGGIRGEGLTLDDFLSTVALYRQQWFHQTPKPLTCMSPVGGRLSQAIAGDTLVKMVKDLIGVNPEMAPNGNAQDVRYAIIEAIGSDLRRRNAAGEECLAVNDDDSKFLICSRSTVRGDDKRPTVSTLETRHSAFIHHALEAGYVWDRHFVSVSNKELKRAREDDKFSNAMHCVENIYLNFCLDPLTDEDREYKARQERAREAENLTQGYNGPQSWLGT